MTLKRAPGSIDPILLGMLLGAMPLSAADKKAILDALARAEQARDKYHRCIVEANQRGASVRDIAAILDVSHQTVANIIRAYNA